MGGNWITGTSDVVTYDYGPYAPIPRGAALHRQHKGLITTTAVQTKAGWLGQVLADQKIVWETDVPDDRETALELADERVASVFEGLFADTDSGRRPADR